MKEPGRSSNAWELTTGGIAGALAMILSVGMATFSW